MRNNTVKQELARLRMWADLILVPGVLLLLYYAVTGRVLSIPVTYVIVDIVVLIGIRYYTKLRRKRQRLEEEEEYSGRARENVRRKLEYMRQLEEEENARCR